MVNRSQGGNDWGEVMMSSASALSNAIVDDMGNVSVAVNQSVDPTSGQKNSEISAIQSRIAQDGDTTDDTVDSYFANSAHNNRRVINVIVNNGMANAAGVAYPSSEQDTGLGYAQFLLLTAADYTKNGGSNNPWCAIYIGPALSMGTTSGGGVGGGAGAGGSNGSGVGVLRLVQ
jgi:hypothetical protein